MSHNYFVRGLLLVAVLAWSSWSGRSVLASPAGRVTPATSSVSLCPVSHPNGGHPPGQSSGQWYRGTGGLWTVLWPRGTVTVPPQNVQHNGWLYAKVPWWRGPGSHGKLRIQGQRLDKLAPALQADVPLGYGDRGFQASALFFPTVGCWQVTGRAGRGSLTMVMRVVKVRK